MGKATKKKSSKSYLTQEMNNVIEYSNQPVSEALRSKIDNSRKKFLAKLKADGLNTLLSLREPKTEKEVNFLFSILKVLFVYDVLLTKTEKELFDSVLEIYEVRDSLIDKLLEEYGNV